MFHFCLLTLATCLFLPDAYSTYVPYVEYVTYLPPIFLGVFDETDDLNYVMYGYRNGFIQGTPMGYGINPPMYEGEEGVMGHFGFYDTDDPFFLSAPAGGYFGDSFGFHMNGDGIGFGHMIIGGIGSMPQNTNNFGINERLFYGRGEVPIQPRIANQIPTERYNMARRQRFVNVQSRAMPRPLDNFFPVLSGAPRRLQRTGIGGRGFINRRPFSRGFAGLPLVPRGIGRQLPPPGRIGGKRAVAPNIPNKGLRRIRTF